MKLTKSQKISLGALAAGLCALAADRTFGGGEIAPAEAAAVAVSPLSDTPAANVAATQTPTPPTLAQRLRGLIATAGPVGAVRDAFLPPPTWARGDAARAAGVATADAFRARHALKATVEAGPAGQALVDGSLLRVGQSLDGLRLIRVERLRAIFTDGDADVALALPGVATGDR